MSVPEGKRTESKLEVIVKALDLATHTIKITANPKIFSVEYKSALTDRIVSTSIEVYMKCWTANNIKIVDEASFNMRKRLQDEACYECNNLLALMQIAKKLFHLDSKKVSYWGKMAIETRNLIRAWRESDRKRYKNMVK